MKVTKEMLKQLIKEELENVASEGTGDGGLEEVTEATKEDPAFVLKQLAKSILREIDVANQMLEKFKDNPKLLFFYTKDKNKFEFLLKLIPEEYR
jgi:hypothetical protein